MPISAKDNPPVHTAPRMKRVPVSFRVRKDLVPMMESAAMRAGVTRAEWIAGVVIAELDRELREAA